ncbi:NUDIX hydrolase [Desulfatitalea alkaliphila]|uniref:CoA pyrophosphatase n=1 Tax=Desulfatitalea alkaliphila TaxID=2929485 RepID=A0AA41UNU4_9BACT|nr:CoA pyrophosphatase [Desulfatitalea alkaliphila]MCJ8499843.1 CoA pyrophosphatase [Desulfatitalea alkaliphila]
MTSGCRLKCDDRLRRQIQCRLQAFAHRNHDQHRLRQAAVAITVVGVDQSSYEAEISACRVHATDAAIILTRRSALLKHHAGQWALPGGRSEPDETPEETALRELQEEVGLSLTRDRILGRLDDFTTRSGFIMTPIVFWGGPEVDLQPDPGEVRSIHRIPIREFLRPDAPILEEQPAHPHPILYMPVGNSWIASPTAALLYQFREVAILGNPTRVAHFDQPRFAWR